MDYDFSYPSTQRTEREEYRSRFRFTDEDEPKRKSFSKQKEKSRTDYLIRLVLLQSVLCILIVAGVFFASKVSPSAFERMKSDYGRIMQKDMSVSEMLEQVKNAADFVFTPSDSVQVISDNAEEESTAENEVAEITEDFALRSYEVTSDETGETVAVGEIVEGSGGGDMKAQEAVKGTSFAPYLSRSSIKSY